MNRRHFLHASVVCFGLYKTHCVVAHQADVNILRLSDDQWLEKLTGPEFDILRLGDTEPAGSSLLNVETRSGMYHCVGCDLVLFDSKWKFESRTGWPSFWRVIPNHVVEQKINGAYRAPIEYHCAQCGGHQGHVFDDGPEPTGLRYCNNGIALKFKPR